MQVSRKVPNFSLELPYISVLGRGERYVLLSKLTDYNKFICDDGSKLRRYLFDSNVRDFMGLNRVNEDIRTTLENDSSPDFWWLNNGVTILATSAKVIGNSIHLEDIQIVNGLQTTESIYKYFSLGNIDKNERAVLIKIIVSKESEIRDSIIRATNNQTLVEPASLRATDKIQRDIEDILLRYEIYYERRKNYYLNQGVKSSLIITPLYLASGYLGLILGYPEIAGKLKSKFMRDPEAYEKIFSENINLEVWPKIAKILKATDFVLENLRVTGQAGTENFLKKWRHIISHFTVSRLIGRFNISIKDLIDFDIDKYTESAIMESWKFIHPSGNKHTSRGKWLKPSYIMNVYEEASVKYNILGIQSFIKRPSWTFDIKKTKDYIAVKKGTISEEFIERVSLILPPQPWKPGAHFEAAKKLDCSTKEISLAIQTLISREKLHQQKDGILYDLNGKIVGIDKDRVDTTTLKLKDVGDGSNTSISL